MTYLKHNNNNDKNGKRKRSKKPPVQGPPPVDPVDVDMSGVEVELANIAKSVRSYVAHACTGENSLALFTGSAEGGYSPLRLVLEGDAVESIAEALTRIADALSGRADAAASNRLQQEGECGSKS